MIGSLHRNQVRILTQEDSRIVSSEPEYDPIGIGVEGLLKSELYGLRSTLAPEVLAKLDRHYELLGKEAKTDVEQVELMQLARELNELMTKTSYRETAAELSRRIQSEEGVRVACDAIEGELTH